MRAILWIIGWVSLVWAWIYPFEASINALLMIPLILFSISLGICIGDVK